MDLIKLILCALKVWLHGKSELVASDYRFKQELLWVFYSFLRFLSSLYPRSLFITHWHVLFLYDFSTFAFLLAIRSCRSLICSVLELDAWPFLEQTSKNWHQQQFWIWLFHQDVDIHILDTYGDSPLGSGTSGFYCTEYAFNVLMKMGQLLISLLGCAISCWENTRYISKCMDDSTCLCSEAEYQNVGGLLRDELTRNRC